MGVKEWGCHCHISPPCSFCVELTEVEVLQLADGGREQLEAYWMSQEETEQTMEECMSVSLQADDGTKVSTSNGEWLAITAMAHAFDILDHTWTYNHDEGTVYTQDQLSQMADRAEQIGKAADWLRELAAGGNARLS